MRSTRALVLLVPLLVLLAGAAPVTLDSRIADYLVQATFIDGLPHAGEPTRIAVTVIEPETEDIPDDPAIVMITGNAVSYQLTLDRAPTTIIALPGLAEGSYDLRVQVPNVGITDALEIRIGKPPLYAPNPLLGSAFIILGVGMLVIILLSERFGARKPTSSKPQSTKRRLER